jgi:hypothetical protein
MSVSIRTVRLWSFPFFLLAGAALALALGKDFAWDSLAYHVYAGYSAVEHRLGADYFASNVQSYLNPYSHVPFYLMLKHGLAPQAIVVALALFHLLALPIVFETGVLLNRRSDGSVAWTPVFLAVALTCLNPVFLLELGTSFNEISTSVPVLLGWYLLLRRFEAPRAGTAALAGILIGAAAALKLTNLFFTLTALPLLLLAPVGVRRRLRAVLAFAGGGLAGAVAAGGWWAWQMWNLFGNPLFPMFNGLFRSPEFTTGAIRHYRFLPDSLGEALARPFAMVLPKAGVHVETVSPDLRYAFLFVLLCVVGLLLVVRRLRASAALAAPAPASAPTRALGALALSFLLTWCLWLDASGNSRYFLPMSALGAVVLATLLCRLPVRARWLGYAVALLIGWQVWTLATVASLRWNGAGWGKSWFELTIPPPLAQPALYLHVSTLPASFLMPFLPAGSSMINLGGQYPVRANAKVQALLARHQGHIRVMRRARADIAPMAAEFDYALLPLGLEADVNDCATIVFLQRLERKQGDQRYYYSSCATRPLSWSAQRMAQFRAAQARAERVFDGIERLCPRLLQPRGVLTEGNGKQFWRNYLNTDTSLRQFGSGRVDLYNEYANRVVEIGNIEALALRLPEKAAFCP